MISSPIWSIFKSYLYKLPHSKKPPSGINTLGRALHRQTKRQNYLTPAVSVRYRFICQGHHRSYATDRMTQSSLKGVYSNIKTYFIAVVNA